MSVVRRWVTTMALAAAIVPAAARAQPQVFVAALSGGAEAPPNASPGTGNAVFVLDQTANTLYINFFFSGLLGTTTAAHIHTPTPAPLSGTAGVATTTPRFLGFPQGVTSGHYQTTLDLTSAASYNPAFVTANGGLAGAETALIAGLTSDRAYLNIHTSVVPGGEIRGFIVAAPEPSTYALLVTGLGALGVVARRRRAA